MKKIFVFVFIISFLASCKISTPKTTITADSFEKESKANVTISGGENNGICINCSK